MSSPIDGFWIPKRLREEVITHDVEYATLSNKNGRPSESREEGAVTVRWPQLRTQHWQRLLNLLQENRHQAPRGIAFWDRFLQALETLGQQLTHLTDPVRNQILSSLPSYTGFSEPMIRLTLDTLEMISLEQIPAAFSLRPEQNVVKSWQSLEGLPGRLRFFSENPWSRGLHFLTGRGGRPFLRSVMNPGSVVGYGAGNVPGTSFLITVLAQSITLTGSPLPVVIVKNSRQEPIFTPMILCELEKLDPELVSTVAVLIWDYQDEQIQDLLLNQADLIMAAASDTTIGEIEAQMSRLKAGQLSGPKTWSVTSPTRFHAHGHKVSFSAVGKEILAEELKDPLSGHDLIDIVSFLAALDSIFWDQFGCLSPRIHFIEVDEAGAYSPQEYANRLVKQMRLLADILPRGAWPLRQVREAFDMFKLLETTKQVQVLSRYDEDFLVAVDQRPFTASTFSSVVNHCQGRVVIVRPLDDLMDLPERHLKFLPSKNLQSLSVAVGRAREKPTDRFYRFAEACGARGVTAIRTVGRGAFPQLAYSWDGYLPLDLVSQRPKGHFTTIEFDAPYDQMIETFRILSRKSSAFELGKS